MIDLSKATPQTPAAVTRLNGAAKRVAEYRQHGCHYAEGTCRECYEMAGAALGEGVNSFDELREALRTAIAVAEEARKEWDAAPNTMRSGKLLIALSGGIKGYRKEIDAIHAALAKAEGR